jgi:serine/threonine protein kinase
MTTDLSTSSTRWLWPFELLERIGVGGMGQVYRARYVVKNIEVAVKILPEDVTDKTALARFERETAVLKNLRHPNIVRCFGGVCEDKRRFYAMEFVSGGSLEDELHRRGQLPWELVIEYGLQMCAALDCSHRHGVIHRDIKPGNFMVGEKGELKLGDFGLASISAGRKITTEGKTAGTLLYMAPEQIRGENITPQTDLYALGCVLFELIAGRPPYLGNTPAETLHMHCKDPVPRVTQYCLECPVTLERIVSSLMDKKPEGRPVSALEVARQLRAVTQTVTVVERQRPFETIASRKVTAATTDEFDKLKAKIVDQVRSGWIFGAGLCVAVAVSFFWAIGFSHQRQTVDAWEKSVIESIGSPDVEVRCEAARILGSMGDRSAKAVETLILGFDDVDPLVRRACALGLADCPKGAQPELPNLKRIVQNESEPMVRDALQQAIANANSETNARVGWTYWWAWLLAPVLGVAGLLWYRSRRKSTSSEKLASQPRPMAHV